VVAGLDARSVTARDAEGLVEAFGEMERLCATAKMLAAARVAGTRVWAADGHRSAAEWLGAQRGSTIGEGGGGLGTAAEAERVAAVEEAVRAGKLSEVQAREVAAAASVDPHAEEQLLASAAINGIVGLRNDCRRVVAAALGEEDLEARHNRIHRSRFHRSWT